MNAVADLIDFNDIASRIRKVPRVVNRDHVTSLYQAFDILKGIPFPPGFVDALLIDTLKTLRSGEDMREDAFVYLAFFGLDNKASHLKIGVAKNVKSRLSGIKTGNPLPNLWTYSARMHSRKMALDVESALLENMSHESVHGEWVRVHGLSEDAVLAVVDSLGELAEHVSKQKLRFLPYEIVQ